MLREGFNGRFGRREQGRTGSAGARPRAESPASRDSLSSFLSASIFLCSAAHAACEIAPSLMTFLVHANRRKRFVVGG